MSFKSPLERLREDPSYLDANKIDQMLENMRAENEEINKMIEGIIRKEEERNQKKE